MLSRGDLLPPSPEDPDALAELAGRWGLDSSVKRLVDAMASLEA